MPEGSAHVCRRFWHACQTSIPMPGSSKRIPEGSKHVFGTFKKMSSFGIIAAITEGGAGRGGGSLAWNCASRFVVRVWYRGKKTGS
jgi:hypothetical protein